MGEIALRTDEKAGRTVTDKSAWFTKVEGASAVLRCKGLLRQVDVYLRDGRLYAKWGSGFLHLRATGTANPDINLDAIDLPFPVTIGKMAAIEIPPEVTALPPPKITTPEGEVKGGKS